MDGTGSVCRPNVQRKNRRIQLGHHTVGGIVSWTAIQKHWIDLSDIMECLLGWAQSYAHTINIWLMFLFSHVRRSSTSADRRMSKAYRETVHCLLGSETGQSAIDDWSGRNYDRTVCLFSRRRWTVKLWKCNNNFSPILVWGLVLFMKLIPNFASDCRRNRRSNRTEWYKPKFKRHNQ